MTDNRKELDRLLAEKKRIEEQIHAMTRDSKGNAYGKLLRQKIFDMVEAYPKPYGGGQQGKVETYKIYTKIHKEASIYAGFKTQLITKDEYEAAVSYLDDTYGKTPDISG